MAVLCTVILGCKVEENGIVYEGDGFGNYRVIGYKGTNPKVVIPETLKGKKVDQIFFDAFKDNFIITEVTLEGNTHLVAGSFVNCPNLEKVNIPSNYNRAGSTLPSPNAFVNCPKMNSSNRTGGGSNSFVGTWHYSGLTYDAGNESWKVGDRSRIAVRIPNDFRIYSNGTAEVGSVSFSWTSNNSNGINFHYGGTGQFAATYRPSDDSIGYGFQTIYGGRATTVILWYRR